MTVFDIEQVLNSTLVQYITATPDSVGLENIVWSNIHYTPEIGRAYMRADCIPADSTPVGVGSESMTREVGFYQISITVPADTGKAAVAKITEELKLYFKQGSSLSYDGVDVRIMKFRPLGTASSADWYTQIIRVNWRSDILN